MQRVAVPGNQRKELAGIHTHGLEELRGRNLRSRTQKERARSLAAMCPRSFANTQKQRRSAVARSAAAIGTQAEKE